MIPGSNLFNIATRLIKPVPVPYYQYKDRVLNAARQWVSGFEAPVKIMASVQAVKRSSYKQLGLDFQKNYTKIYAAVNLINIDRDSAGDQFIFNGMVYQLEENTRWFVIDGWASALGVEVRRATQAELDEIAALMGTP